MLRNDGINFMKAAHGVYGYTLKPGTYGASLWINPQGFPQREVVPIQRRRNSLRIMCLGESTTFGNSSLSNYPAYLQAILRRDARGFQDYEVINAGVPGWISDQIALRVKNELSQYKPDVVLLYVGWNDFQSYDPLNKPPQVSYFEAAYGRTIWKQQATGLLRSVALASAMYHHRDRIPDATSRDGSAIQHNSPDQCYRFLLQSLDNIVLDFRKTNSKSRVFVCSLVGRWPEINGGEWAKFPTVWWIKEHHLDAHGVVPFVRALNEQLRAFAHSRNLDFIDVAAAFETLDRAKLQWDWAHMTSEGYELMAWTMFSALQGAGVLQRASDRRYDELVAKYQLNASRAGSSSP